MSGWLLPMTPAIHVPSARIVAPVSVAMSMIASRLGLGREHEAVRHHEAPLGVGVHHLDRRPAVHRDHVAELERGPRRHVVRAHEVAGHDVGAAELAEHRHRREDGGGPGHVVLHRRVDGVGRLEADAARVVHDPLGHQREVAGRALDAGHRGRAVGELDHARLVGAAAVDAEEPAAAEPRQRRLVEDLDLEAAIGADGDRDVGDPRRGQVRGRGVREVAGEQRGRGEDPAAFRARRDGVSIRGVGDQGDRRDALGAGLALERLVRIAREQDALDDDLGGRRRVDVGEGRDPCREPALPARRERECRRRVPDAVGVDRGRVADPDGHLQRTAVAEDEMRLARLPSNPSDASAATSSPRRAAPVPRRPPGRRRPPRCPARPRRP